MNLTVASSPHIRGDFKTRRIMLDVVLALLPALAVGVFMHGFRSVQVVLVSVVCCIACEWLYGILTKTRCKFFFTRSESFFIYSFWTHYNIIEVTSCFVLCIACNPFY